MVLWLATWRRKRLTVDQSPRSGKATRLFSIFPNVGWTSMLRIRRSAIGWPNGRPRLLVTPAEFSPSMPRWFPRHRKALLLGRDNWRPRDRARFSLIAGRWHSQIDGGDRAGGGCRLGRPPRTPARPVPGSGPEFLPPHHALPRRGRG